MPLLHRNYVINLNLDFTQEEDGIVAHANRALQYLNVELGNAQPISCKTFTTKVEIINRKEVKTKRRKKKNEETAEDN